MNKKTNIGVIFCMAVIILIIVIFAVRGIYISQPTIQQPPTNTTLYKSSTEGFSIYYPIGFTVNENYVYQELGPGKDINGVKFTIPASLASGTNLGSDSYLSVEEIPG